MKGELRLSQKEARRLYVMEQLCAGHLTVEQAALALDLSTRQVKRLKKRFAIDQAAALVHGNRGRQPAHTIPKEVRQIIAERAQNAYRETSCEHMAELLSRFDNIHVSGKSVARILKAAGIPLRYLHKPARRRRSRDRMPQLGLLVQLDASQHAWLEDRGPELHLHGAIDDATGRILGLRFELQETTLGYLHVLEQMLSHHGVPHSIYTDRRTVFFSPKAGKLSIEQELAGETDALTQLGYVLNDLGIHHIPASSPQAKGRIERLWGTLQSRLIVELRVANISTLEDANRFLLTFQDEFNHRFAVGPADPVSALKPSPTPARLRQILTIRRGHRLASRGSTISYAGVTYQLTSSHRIASLAPRSSVQVLTHMDGAISAWYEGAYYELTPYHPKPKRPLSTQAPMPKAAPKPPKPNKDHPWNQAIGRYKQGRTIRATLPPDEESRRFWDDIMSQR